jgi:signal transduction histidine kinase
MTSPYSQCILFLEDDEDLRSYVSHLLGSAGYEVAQAENLVDGLRLAKVEDYNLYLFDYHLPDGTGIELCRLIRAFDTSTPILIYSSITDEDAIRAAFSAGAQGFINKSDALQNLKQIVAQLIASKKEVVTPREQRGQGMSTRNLEQGRDIQNLERLAALIRRERAALLSQWREQVRQLPSAECLDTPTLNDHVPALLDELAAAFGSVSDQTIPESLLEGNSPAHGLQRQQDGFDIVEVVAEYNILRGCIHDLAENHGLTLESKSFHILNRVLDDAIGLAVQTFATKQALEVERRREEYLAFVAHDLRSPLNAISIASQILQTQFPGQNLGAQTAQMLKTLSRNVQRLQLLVEKILKESDHIQTETGVKLERREFDLWPLIEALIYDLHPVAETASTRLTNEIPQDLTVYADASLLKRVFQNLVANAIKYTPRGEVVIGAQETGSEGGVECWVSDNGAGIPEDRLEIIFDKQETDPEKEGGTGLGLAIVKTFVEAHGGEVTVESKEGIGSTFRFTLPDQATLSGS